MGIGQSFWNGLLATPCGLYELGRYFLKWWFNKPLSYPQVPEIWTERSRLEVASYGFGQFVFLAWPALVGRLGCADSRVVFWLATPCGLYELGRYFLKWWFNKPLSYPQVPEIW